MSEEALWTREVVHRMKEDFWEFSELEYSIKELPTQLGVGAPGNYLYLLEDEVEEYIADLRRAVDIVFGRTLKVVPNE